MEYAKDTFFHSVTLDKNKCVGCTNCIKKCPTEAIRVRDGKATILSERCVDCGECIRICPHHAKLPIYTPFSEIHNYKYKIALPAPALYGQFHNLLEIDTVLNGLLNIGFDDVFEVAAAAEIVSEVTRQALKDPKQKRPIISSACPVIVRLIRVRFPDLCDRVLNILAPMEVAARTARKAAIKKTGLKSEDIGIFFISPCPAKVTDIKAPLWGDVSAIDGTLAMSEVYPKLLTAMKNENELKPLLSSGLIGVGWAGIGGESAALFGKEHMAADGIENVIRVLEELEDEKLRELDFIELNACSAGCVGGVLTVENPYVARSRISRLKKHLPVSCNHLGTGVAGDIKLEELRWKNPLKYQSVMKLSDNLLEAIDMMNRIENLNATLPGLDCGACGAPACRALAEDVIKGLASEESCIFVLRDRIAAERKRKQEAEGII